MDRQTVIDATRRWITSIVIGLNLCPFAERVFLAGKIRYVVTESSDEKALLLDLAGELQTLVHSPLSSIETTFLIHPSVLGTFADYNDFLGAADQLLRELGLRGTIQLASFHPEYQFAGTDSRAVENYTNRSPYPMLHLLREQRNSEVAHDPSVLQGIPRRNIETLRDLGRDRVLELLKAIEVGRKL